MGQRQPPSAAPPIDTTINGQPRKLVAEPSKQVGSTSTTASRVSRWPIPEVATPQTNMPTERPPTQPIPTNPPPLPRTYVAENDLIDFTPALRARALREPEEVPFGTVAARATTRPGTISGWVRVNIGNAGGGVNWPGSGFDPRPASSTRRPITRCDDRQATSTKSSTRSARSVQSRVTRASRGGKPTPRKGRNGTNQPGAARPLPVPQEGSVPGAIGSSGLAEGLDGLLIVKPPYGVIAGYRPRRRRQAVPGAARRHAEQHPQSPDAAGMNIPEDQAGRQRRHHGHQDGGCGRRCADHLAAWTWTRRDAARLRQKTGAEVGAVLMPAGITGSPMTYSVDGRQHHRRGQRR